MNKRVALSKLSPLMEEILQNDGEVTLTVTGDSMRPLLGHLGDKVCLVKPDKNKLKKYDIPLFVRGDGKYILHRIVRVKEDGYVILGDNQCVKEYPVLHSQIIGVVKHIWRNGNYISCDDFWYKAYCRLWLSAYPLRCLYFRAKQFFIRTIRFLGDKSR